jgi:ACS family hexuronate transporter-like MFS transporter
MPARAISTVVGLGGFVGYFFSGVVSKITGAVLARDPDNYAPLFLWASSNICLLLIAIQLLVPRIPQSSEADAIAPKG